MSRDLLKRVHNREVRRAVEAALARGWTVCGSTKGLKIYSPDGATLIPVHATPSDCRAHLNLDGEIRRAERRAIRHSPTPSIPTNEDNMKTTTTTSSTDSPLWLTGVATVSGSRMKIRMAVDQANAGGISSGDGFDVSFDETGMLLSRHHRADGKHWRRQGTTLEFSVYLAQGDRHGLVGNHPVTEVAIRSMGDEMWIDLPRSFFAAPPADEESLPAVVAENEVRPAAPPADTVVTPMELPRGFGPVELKSAIDLLNEAVAATDGVVSIWQEEGGRVRAKVVMEMMI